MELLYYKYFENVTKAYTSEGITIEENLNHLLEKLCDYNLFSLKGYRSSVKRHFGFHKQAPLYINERLVLLPIASEKSLFLLNWRSVLSYNFTKREFLVLFIDGSFLVIPNINSKIKIKIEKMKLIINHKEKEVIKRFLTWK